MMKWKQTLCFLAVVGSLGVEAFLQGVAKPFCFPMLGHGGKPRRMSTLPIGDPSKNLFKSAQQRATAAKTLNNGEVIKWRAVAFSFFTSLFVFRNAIDAKLATLWTYLITSSSLAARIFRTDSYEWILAIAAFVFYIHFFWFADRAVRKVSEQGRVHPWRKYRLQDRFEADMLRRKRQKSEVVTLQERTSQGDTHVTTKHSDWNYKAWTFELLVYALPLLTWDILSPRRHRRLAAFSAPKVLTILRDISCGLLLYDFMFFAGHVLMHKIPFLYRTIHSKHHQVQEVRAGDVVRLTLVEEVLEVGFSIIALNLLGAHPVARSIYNCIIVFLLTELHCGFDFPWTPQNVVPFGLSTGSRRHHYHHRFNRHYYQKFFHTFDRLFGYFHKDDGSVQGDSVKASAYVPSSWE
jgi:sterol desaturase/sphingolipid hydroxylase (fatty acid hydroxylase superfamily)